MIGSLFGSLIDKTPPGVLLEVHGVGLEVQVPMSTFFNLPALGQHVRLLTHLVVREDALTLFGFLTAGEREAFRQLIRISGIGPRTALAVLSGLSTEELSAAVAHQEAGRLIKVPGIGKKTAERLLLELKDKLGAVHQAPVPAVSQSQTDIVQALVTLGYSERDAQVALKKLPADIEVGEGIRQALKSLG